MQGKGLRTLIAAASVVLVACGGAEPSDPAVAGAEVFADNCAVCHGKELQGTTTGPPLLHDYYKPSHHSDDSFRSAVANGVAPHHWDFGPMPAFPDISPDETEALITYIRGEQRAAGIQ